MLASAALQDQMSSLPVEPYSPCLHIRCPQANAIACKRLLQLEA
jgi:hypothetical protein